MMKNKYKTNDIYKYILIFIIITFLFIRFQVAVLHFTHYDDLYPIYILKEINSYTYEKMNNQLLKYGVNEITIKFFYEIFGNYYGLKLMKLIVAPIVISKTSTFAPLQFYISNVLTNIETEYITKIFLSRLTSLLSSIIYLYGTIKLFDELGIIRRNIDVIGFLTFPLTSWMFLIYSSQSENYVIGLIYIPYLLMAINNCNKITYQFRDVIKINILIVASILSTYQLIWFLPGLLIAYSINIYKNINISRKNKYIYIFHNILFASFLVILVFKIFIQKLLIERSAGSMKIGIGWNAGIDNQYQFSDGWINGLKEIINFPKFIFNNYCDVLWSMIGFGDYNDYIKYIYIFIFTALCGYGIYITFKEKKFRFISYFSIINLFVWLSFILLGMLAFSPTRHSLIYMSLLWIYSGLAVIEIFKNGRVQIKYFTLSCLIILIVLFIKEYSNELDKRKNLYIKNSIIQKIINDKPGYIFTYNFTLDLNMDKNIDKDYEREWINKKPFFEIYKRKINNNKNIMILCNSHKDCYEPKNIDELYANNNIDIKNYIVNDYSSVRSKTSVCYGDFTVNGTNEILFKYLIFK